MRSLSDLRDSSHAMTSLLPLLSIPRDVLMNTSACKSAVPQCNDGGASFLDFHHVDGVEGLRCRMTSGIRCDYPVPTSSVRTASANGSNERGEFLYVCHRSLVSTGSLTFDIVT